MYLGIRFGQRLGVLDFLDIVVIYLISAIKRRSRYFAKLKRSGRGSARWQRKKKYIRYNVREDARIFKQQLNKWITLFLDNELPLRYYFFNNLKAPFISACTLWPVSCYVGEGNSVGFD